MRRFFELLFLLMVVMLLCSCCFSAGVRPSVPTIPPTPPVSSPLVEQLQAIGQILLWSGAGILALGLGIRVAAALGILGPIGIVSRLVPFLPGIGIANLGLGCALVWLSDNLWVLGVSCALALLAFGIHYRRIIRRWVVVGEATGKRQCLDSKG